MTLTLPARVCLGLLAAFTVSAAENVAEYNARVWQSDEGLPVDSAWTGAQTPDGYLWVGTRAGLARFDGEQFTVFDQHNIPGMTAPNIIGLRTTRDGSLWVATDDGVLCLKGGNFTHYSTKQGLAGNDCVGSIFEDAEGAIWIGSMHGLSRFKDGVAAKVSDAVVRGMCQDLCSNIWMATTNGIDCWSNGAVVLHLGRTNELDDPDLRAICCGTDGTIWVGVGADVKRIDHGAVKTIIPRDRPSYNVVTYLYQDKRGTFWAGTYSGLDRIVNGKFVPVLNNDGLPYGAVMYIFEDREGDVWACAKDGLVRLKPNRVLCYTQRQGLGNDNVSSVMEDRKGDLRIGTWGAGVSRLRDGVMTTYTNTTSFPALALGICEDNAGAFWVGTDFSQGIYQLRGSGARHYIEQNGQPIPAVRVIYQDRATNLWFGTSVGLFQMRDGNPQLYQGGRGLGGDVIRDICEDGDGNLWIATQAGLVRERNGVLTRFDASNGLAHDYVLTVFADKANTVWLGTLGGGLVRLRNGRFVNYTTRDGLFSDNICSIIEDDNGRLWMGSNRGIFCVDKNNLHEFDRRSVARLRVVFYGKTDGMMNKICNGVAKPSVCKSRDGRLWFTTIKGLCVIDPKTNVLGEAPPPPVVIEDLQTEHGYITGPKLIQGPIRVQPGKGELEFHYAALGFRAPEENRYKYKLEGLDSDWVDAGNRRIAHYNNVYPGHYSFHVVACNSDGVWNEIGATVAVVMLPHVWENWWFQPALLMLAGGALAILYRIILLRRREIEQLRVRIAADLHDEIGSNLASIALLSQLGEKTSDKTGSSELSEIHRIALLTVNGIREIVWFINPAYDTMPEMMVRMRDVAAQMLNGLDYTFDSPGASGGGKLSPEFRRNLFLIFKEILHNIAKHSRARRVQISLAEEQGMVHLRVVDDGRGFDPVVVSRGNGLRNIRLRAGQLGGSVDIAPGIDGGTVVTVAVKVT